MYNLNFSITVYIISSYDINSSQCLYCPELSRQPHKNLQNTQMNLIVQLQM